MVKDTTPQSVELDIKALETRIDDLIRTCKRLKEENLSLKNQQISLKNERARLIEKNELARVRVESILNRLKGMEQST